MGHEARNKEEGGKDRESLKQLSQLKKRAKAIYRVNQLASNLHANTFLNFGIGRATKTAMHVRAEVLSLSKIYWRQSCEPLKSEMLASTITTNVQICEIQMIMR